MLDDIHISDSDWIQVFIAILMLITIIVALFRERFWRWKDRPQLRMQFEASDERCSRNATVMNEQRQNENRVLPSVTRQYFRLHIHNKGGNAYNLKAKVDLFDSERRPADRFEPNLLRWVDGSEILNLAQNEDHYLNLFSQILCHPEVKDRLRIEIANPTPRGISWDRPLVPWIFKVTIYGDDMRKIVVKHWKFSPSAEPKLPGVLDEISFHTSGLWIAKMKKAIENIRVNIVRNIKR